MSHSTSTPNNNTNRLNGGSPCRTSPARQDVQVYHCKRGPKPKGWIGGGAGPTNTGQYTPGETPRTGKNNYQAHIEKAKRVPADDAHKPGTFVAWRWGYTDDASKLHVLGDVLDGSGHRLTHCGCLSHVIEGSERVCADFEYGPLALSSRGINNLCLECYVVILKKRRRIALDQT